MMVLRLATAAVLVVSSAIAVMARAPAAPAGAQVYSQRCAMCHSVTGRNGVGPTLRGVAGRRAAGQPGYAYSAALSASGLVWSDQALDSFLAAPQKVVPGTKMPIALADPAQRQALIQYLRELR